MNTIGLQGCTTQPLGSYLKALAVLRLLSEQADTEARGWWEAGYFWVDSQLDRDGLLDFFMSRYRPTPIIAPWNGGSGFCAKDRKIGIDAIAKSTDPRFETFRISITCARSIPEVSSAKGASKAEEDERRAAILRACRNSLPDAAVDWLDSAVAIASDGSRAFAPILGTGGNEGRLDYTNNFMENIASLLLSAGKYPVRALLENALFDTQTIGLRDLSVGQYDPGRAGGFNQGQGIEASAMVNPWNPVLTVEGAVAWAAGIYRKQGVSFRSFLCSPFTVRASAVGYASASGKDDSAARAEIWVPIWTRRARYAEIRSLLREGRAAVGEKPAHTGLEFAHAVASLGVDRSIAAFVRYSLLKRRGDSYVALPTGEFAVKYRSDCDLVRQLAPVLAALDRAAKGQSKEPPSSWQPLRRAIDAAMYQVLLHGNPEVVRDLAIAIGDAHRWCLDRGHRPYFPVLLGPEWISRCVQARETAAEVRIAAALASLSMPSVLKNLSRSDREYAWVGRNLPSRMLSVIRHRALRSESSGSSPFAARVEVGAQDIARFIEADVDDDMIENLLFAFLATDLVSDTIGSTPADTPLWPAYAIIKHLFLPGPVAAPDGPVQLSPDPSIPALLQAGRVREAVAVAVRRLRIIGLNPVEAEYDAGLDSLRLGAALLIPMFQTARFRAVAAAATRDICIVKGDE